MIGETIKLLREKKGLKLNELARMAGVNASYLSALENNKKQNPSRDILKKLSNKLDMSVEDIIRYDLYSNDNSYGNQMIKPDDDLDKQTSIAVAMKNRYLQKINSLINSIKSTDEENFIYLLSTVKNAVDFINARSSSNKSTSTINKEGDTT